jgi:putative transposase
LFIFGTSKHAMTKFKNKYRIPSARASWWDYANPGSYFITICTDRRRHHFGRIVEKQMFLSAIGDIVAEEWDKSFVIRKELYCDAFVIMPNHLHAIVRIEPTNDPVVPYVKHGVAFRSPKSVSTFVGGFKAAVTKRVNILNNTPEDSLWQVRFHDNIIQTDISYLNIAKYIDENPSNWRDDRFYTDP